MARTKLITAIVAVIGLVAFTAWKANTDGLGMAAVAVAPFAGAVFAYYFIKYGVGAIYREIKGAAHATDNGKAYTFDNVQIHVRFENQQYFVLAEDLMQVMHKPASNGLLRAMASQQSTARLVADPQGQWWFTQTGAIDWITPQAAQFNQQARRLKYWLERDVFR